VVGGAGSRSRRERSGTASADAAVESAWSPPRSAVLERLGAVARRRPLQIGVFIEAPAICVIALLAFAVKGGHHLQDFGWLRAGALSVLHGATLYPPPDPGLLELNNAFVYPPIDAYALVPVAILPRPLSYAIFFVLSLGALLVALRLLGVRDWRCYTLTIVTPVAFIAFAEGALGPLLLLGVAAGWAYRDRAWRVGVIVGLTVVAKLFLWPLLVWLAATRRWKAFAAALATCVLSVLGPWAGLGFEGLRAYPRLLQVLESVQVPKSYSLAGLAWDLGLSSRIAVSALLVVAVVGCAAVVKAAGRADGDAAALALAVTTALAATPLLWVHYLVLLFVPVALLYPRLAWAWAAPLVLWVSPGPGAVPGVAWQPILALVVVTMLGALLWARPSPPWRAAAAHGAALDGPRPRRP
jgi:hypothetical protein